MARFRDMRKFVRFVKDEHQSMVTTKNLASIVNYAGSDFEWPNGDEARAKYSDKTHKTITEVSDICDDCIIFHFLRTSDTFLPEHDFTLVVTSRGRHLLLRLGLLREVAKDNSDWLNLMTAFLVGLLSAVILTLGSVWIFEHTKPIEVNITSGDKTRHYHISD